MMKSNEKTALLIMDLQNGIVSRYSDKPDILVLFQKAVEAARGNDIHVIFVHVAFSEGYPENNPRNKMFSALSKSGE